MIIFGYGNRFNGLARAIISMLAGLALIIWPGMATVLMVKFFAIVLIVKGIFSLVFGLFPGADPRTPTLSVNAFIEVLFAVVLYMGAEFIAGFIIYIIAFLLMFFAVYQTVILFGAISAMRSGRLTLLLPGLVIVAALLLLFAAGTEWVSYIAGGALILYGITDLVSLWTVRNYASEIFKGFSKRRMRHGMAGKKDCDEEVTVVTGNPEGRPSPMGDIDYDNVKDVDYEKVDEK